MRKVKQFLSMLLMVSMLTVPVSAAGFTASVEQKGAPVPNQKNVTVTALADLDKAPEKVQKVVEAAYKSIAEEKSVAKAVPAVEKALKVMMAEMKANTETDGKTDEKTNSKTDGKTNGKTNSKTDGKTNGKTNSKTDEKNDAKISGKVDEKREIKAEDLVVRDLFHVELDKDLKDGREKVVIFNTEGIEKGDFLMVMVFVDGEWIVLDSDRVKITADGKVQVTFNVVGPVAFIAEK